MVTRATDTGGSSGSSSSGLVSWQFSPIVVSSRSWWSSVSGSAGNGDSENKEIGKSHPAAVVDKDKEFILRKGEKTYAS